jgi:hypothetical protein
MDISNAQLKYTKKEEKLYNDTTGNEIAKLILKSRKKH